MEKVIDNQLLDRMKKYQRAEMTAYLVYKDIAKKEKNEENRRILEEFSEQEKKHADFFKEYTQEEIMPSKLRLFMVRLINFIFGYTFTIKLMEHNEEMTIEEYRRLEAYVPEISHIIQDEVYHENALIEMLNEERLNYVGAMVLGLNDALVELTGTIAGLTFALANTKLIALSGIVTGISATLSMAASNYLAENAEGNKNALKSSVYTGVAYLVTVVLMVLPYLLLPEDMYVQALVIMIIVVLLIILVFNFYISIAKSQSFKKNFLTMVTISMGVAVIAFVIGVLAKRLLGIDI